MLRENPFCCRKKIPTSRSQSCKKINARGFWAKRRVDAGKILVLSDMTFKGRPETSDLRGSSSVNIARKLFAAGYKLRLHDFVTPIEVLENLKLGKVFADLSATCKEAAALLDTRQACKKIDLAFTLGNFLLEEGGTCAK